jgi:TP901 family phage tail tape measure protein
MAEDIKQTLGFDVSQSLEALAQLDAGFAKMQTNLQGSVRNFDSFNASAGKTVAALIQITSRANEAADALNKLNSIKPPPTTPGGGLPPLPASPAGGLTGSAAAQAMAQLLGQVTTAANTAAPALNNAGQAANNAGSAFANASGRSSGFAISLETLSRVVGTQVIVRALSTLREAIEGSFQGFIEFNRKVAEIQTISTEPLDALAKSVRDLSDQFNAPLLDVAAAKYQILSNGFTSTADSTKVLTAALKFSKVGLADVASSADLISSALNAYGKSANEAETISAKLFKTIELGRVVGQELATSFGRVAPVAKEIGASESEILAAFSSITIGGVKASEAATQIRATLTGLLKPSKDTAEAFRKLGVESGEQLIQAKGFQGALQALIGTTDGSAAAIAKLFPNVRALNGVLRETTTGATIFAEHLKEIQAASGDLLNKKFELRIESNAERVSADLNKIKNFFTVDLGKTLVDKVGSFTNLIGGVDTLITGFRNLTPVVGAVVTALVAYNVGMLTASAGAKLLALANGTAATSATVLGGALTGVIAVIAAQQLGQFIGESITRSIEGARRKAEDESNQALQFERDQSSARIAIAETETAAKAALIHSQVAEARRGTFEVTDAAKEANKNILEDDKATFDKIVAARQKFANDLKKAAIQAENDVIESRKRSNDLQNQLDDRRFNVQISRLNDVAKAESERRRAEQLANEAAGKLANASKPEEQANAQAEFNRAQAFAQEALATAKSSGNRAAQVNAERTLEQILQRRIQAEKSFQAERQADADRIAKEAAAEEARVTKLKDLAKDFLTKSNFFDKKGELLPQETVQKNLADAKVLLQKFKDEAFGPGSKFKLDDLFSFDKLEARLNQSVTRGEVKELFASSDALEKLFQQVQSVFKNRKILIDAAIDPSKLKGKNDSDAANEVDAQVNALQDKVNSLRQASEQRRDAEATIGAEVKKSNDTYGEQKGLIEQAAEGAGVLLRSLVGAGGAAVQAKQQLQGLRNEAQQLLNNPNATKEQIDALGQKFRDTVSKVPKTSQEDANRASEEFNALVKVFEERQKIKDLDRTGQTPKPETGCTKAARTPSPQRRRLGRLLMRLLPQKRKALVPRLSRRRT